MPTGWHMWHVTHWTHLDSWTNGALWPYWMLLDCLPSLPWCICHHLPATNSLGLSYAVGGPEEHSPLQVPPGMESPVASPSGLPSDFGIDPLIERMNTSDAVAFYRHIIDIIGNVRIQSHTVTIMSFQFTRLWHQSNVLSQALEDSVREGNHALLIQRSNCHKLPVHQVTWSRSKLGP